MQNKIPISTLYEVYVDGDVAFKGDVLVREPAPQPRRAGPARGLAGEVTRRRRGTISVMANSVPSDGFSVDRVFSYLAGEKPKPCQVKSFRSQRAYPVHLRHGLRTSDP